MTDKPKFKLRSKTKPMSRIDIIGSNGGTGEHYTEIKEYYISVDMANGEDYSVVQEPFFEKSYLDQKRQMMEENERSEVFGKWISVEDELPEGLVPVIFHAVINTGSYITVGHKHPSFNKFKDFTEEDESNSIYNIGEVTHWMPLPSPPTEAE